MFDFFPFASILVVFFAKNVTQTVCGLFVSIFDEIEIFSLNPYLELVNVKNQKQKKGNNYDYSTSRTAIHVIESLLWEMKTTKTLFVWDVEVGNWNLVVKSTFGVSFIENDENFILSLVCFTL